MSLSLMMWPAEAALEALWLARAGIRAARCLALLSEAEREVIA